MISIAALNEKDRKRREKEIAQNSLETFILDTQDKLTQEEFESVTTEEERTNILEKCSQVFFLLLLTHCSFLKENVNPCRPRNGYMTKAATLKLKCTTLNYKS